MNKIIDKATLKKFKNFLDKGGAEILIITNPWEVLRFKVNDEIGVLYKNSKNQKIKIFGIAIKVFYCFENNEYFDFKKKNKEKLDIKRRTLLERDGLNCFFCNKQLGDDTTVEHLLSRNCGGSNHINNLALAHYKCNQLAAHLNIVDKVKLRDTLTIKKGETL